MGPLFVVIVWAIIGSLLGAGAACFALLLNLRKPRELWAKRVVFAAVLPFFAIGWAGFCVAAFAIWSSLTGMHLGFGNFADFSDVPLANGYAVWLIDTNEKGSIHHGESSLPLVTNVREIGQDGDAVFGRADAGFFTLNTKSGDLKQGMGNAEYASTLSHLELGTPALTAVGRFYTGRRWNLLDSVLVALQVTSPLVAVGFVWYKYMRLDRPGAAEPPHAGAGVRRRKG